MKDTSVRFIGAVFKPQEIDTYDNVARALFGVKYGEIVGGLTRKFVFLPGALTLLWMAGWVVLILALLKLIPEWTLPIGSIATLPLILVANIPMMNVPLVTMLLPNFDVLLTFYNLAGLILGFALQFPDQPTVYISWGLALFVSFSFIPFFDALPAGARRFSKPSLIFSLGFMATFQVCLYYNWFQTERKQFYVGEMVFTAESIMSGATTSIMILFVKFLISSVFHPSSMTVVKARVKSEKVESGTYSMLVAMFEMFEEELDKRRRT